jgi:putative transposase
MPSRIDQQQLLRIWLPAARTDGVELIGLNGLLTRLTRSVLETALDAELTEQLGYDSTIRWAATGGTPVTGPDRRGC